MCKKKLKLEKEFFEIKLPSHNYSNKKSNTCFWSKNLFFKFCLIFFRFTGLPLPYQCCAQANPWEKMVHGTPNYYSSGWNLAFRFDIYRNVFYFHIVLGLQNLLRIWIYAVGLLYFGRCYCLCDYSLHIFPAKCRRLPMVRLFLVRWACVAFLRIEIFLLPCIETKLHQNLDNNINSLLISTK